MKILKIFVVVLLALMALASGVAKVMQLPQELDFFQSVGMNVTGVLALGVAQLLAALLLISPRSRLPGAVLLALTLMVSTIAIFMAGKMGFGAFSMVPIVLALWVATNSWSRPVNAG